MAAAVGWGKRPLGPPLRSPLHLHVSTVLALRWSIKSNQPLVCARMVFTSPHWVPQLPIDPPDNIPLNEFILNEDFGRHLLNQSRPPFTCGFSGAEYSIDQVCDRVVNLARSISKEVWLEGTRPGRWSLIVDSLDGVQMQAANGIKSLAFLV